MQDRLALLRIELCRLLANEPVDVGIAAIRIGAGRGRERLDPGRRVPGDTAQAVDDVLQLLFLVRLEERRPLEWPKPRADPDGLKIVEEGLGVVGGAHVAPEIHGVKALRVPGFREELSGLGQIVGIDRRLPVEVEARRNDAPGDSREPERLSLIDRVTVHGIGGGQAHAPVVPWGAGLPLVGEDDPVRARELRRLQGEPG